MLDTDLSVVGDQLAPYCPTCTIETSLQRWITTLPNSCSTLLSDLHSVFCGDMLALTFENAAVLTMDTKLVWCTVLSQNCELREELNPCQCMW